MSNQTSDRPPHSQSQHSPESLSPTQSQSSLGYKRASRKGAPRRYACHYEGCDRVYSRQEHLQRHQLNHAPKEIFACDVDNCGQRFVRADLLARHRKRHSSSYTPRNRVQSFAEPGSSPALPPPSTSATNQSVTSATSGSSRYSPTVLRDASVLMTPDATAAAATGSQASPATPSGWPPSRLDDMLRPSKRLLPSYSQQQQQQQQQQNRPSSVQPNVQHLPLLQPHAQPFIPQAPSHDASSSGAHALPEPSPVLFAADSVFTAPAAPAFSAPSAAAAAFADPYDVRNNFTTWLFDAQAGLGDFNVSQLPFFQGGLETPFNNNMAYDYESLTSRSHMDTPPRQPEPSDEVVGDFRRQELVQIFNAYRHMAGDVATEDPPLLSPEVARESLHEFWEHVAPRVPIIHRPTFSCNRCPPLLLIVMLALGAASRARYEDSASASSSSSSTNGALDLYLFGNIVITHARFAILTSDEASPPVSLWVAQALLLVEFYEKMFSTRRLHERSHIYHSVTLTLLRRGSPLIGRSGSESPPDEAIVGDACTEAGSPPTPLSANTMGRERQTRTQRDSFSWWNRWAETEAMHRVVFAAFCLDVTHAAMFGHMADMGPHEICLPLPCDDNLWTATKPEDVKQFDNGLRMYGIKPITFLDGLKKAVHGKEVQTHSFGRMIIMSGLLSVGWHLSHRETHLKWLDSAQQRPGPGQSGLSSPAGDGPWRTTLLAAFDRWKLSFDSDLVGASGSTAANNGPIQSAAVLYHLAHLCLYVNIVDCQVYAGAKRLLGRKVTSRDYTNVVARMETWAKHQSTKHAVLHALTLLCTILVDGRGDEYALKNESDPHRPWIMYYAALSVWSFVKATGGVLTSQPHGRPATFARVAAYLSKVASLDEKGAAAPGLPLLLADGLPDLLDYLQQVFGAAHSELLQEAQVRLQACRDGA